MSIVTYEKDGAVGVVTLAKPPHNLIDEAFLEALLTAYANAVAEGSRSILLRSSMRHQEVLERRHSAGRNCRLSAA